MWLLFSALNMHRHAGASPNWFGAFETRTWARSAPTVGKATVQPGSTVQRAGRTAGTAVSGPKRNRKLQPHDNELVSFLSRRLKHQGRAAAAPLLGETDGQGSGESQAPTSALGYVFSPEVLGSLEALPAGISPVLKPFPSKYYVPQGWPTSRPTCCERTRP